MGDGAGQAAAVAASRTAAATAGPEPASYPAATQQAVAVMRPWTLAERASLAPEGARAATDLDMIEGRRSSS